MKKIISTIGIAMIAMTMFFNISISTDNDIDGSLTTLNSIANAYAASSDAGSGVFKYKQNEERVHCTNTKTTYVRNEDSNLVNYGGKVKGEADWKLFNIEASGYADASNGEKASDYTKKTVTADFWTDKYLCPPGEKSTCVKYDPCTGAREQLNGNS